MNNIVQKIDVQDIAEISNKIQYRLDNFDEDLPMAVGVVLMNYGDKHRQVRCVNGEWVGQKKDLESGEGIPLCPGGHPLLEAPGNIFLAVVEE